MTATLTAELVEAFAAQYLAVNYDTPRPTPAFHRESWELYCSDALQAAVIAPRGHAKSTALTLDYTVAAIIFRAFDYIVIIGSNEEMGMEALGEVAKEFRDNEELIRDWGVEKLEVDSKAETIIRFEDGHRCRIIARGSGQKMRGRKWNGKRPGLVLCDDLEDDEQVESQDRREKFRRWFARAVKPMLRVGGKLRIHGTILHEDSLLNRIVKDPEWQVKFYRAHRGFDDFRDILWPEMFNEESLRRIRQNYINQFDAAGYSQEYLNDPFDNSVQYLRREDFVPMSPDDYRHWQDGRVRKCVGCDFAVSKADKANRTSFTVGGLNETNRVLVADQYVGRWDALEWVDMMFSIHETHNPEYWFVEDGVIWKTIAGMIDREMRERNIFLHIVPIASTKDKATRGRPYQKRHRAHAVSFDKAAEWYPPYEHEQLRFTGRNAAIADDQFDSTAILIVGLDKLPVLDEEDFMDDDELYQLGHGRAKGSDGRDSTTGY